MFGKNIHVLTYEFELDMFNLHRIVYFITFILCELILLSFSVANSGYSNLFSIRSTRFFSKPNLNTFIICHQHNRHTYFLKLERVLV